VPESDIDLVARLLSGDGAAFGELVARHQGDVRRLLRRLTGDAALADDLAQESFLRAYRRRLIGSRPRSSVATSRKCTTCELRGSRSGSLSTYPSVRSSADGWKLRSKEL
jgi:hypothetical protein